MRSRFLPALVGCVLTGTFAVLSAISIPAGPPYSQTFDGIGTDAIAALPADFKADALTGARVVGTFAAAGVTTTRSGGPNLGGTAANGIYNFGAGAAGNFLGTDRAVGFLSSGTGTQSGNLYARLTNDTASALTALQIAYNVEKYRGGINPAGFRIQLFYSTDGVAWTSAGPDFTTFFGPDAANAGFAPAPGATVGVDSALSVAIPTGGAFYLAWNYSVASGTTTSNAQALAIDDIRISGSADGAPPGDAAPAVVSVTPADGAINVPVASSVVITFSESVSAGPGAFALQCPAGSPHAFAQSPSPASTFTLTPAAPLPHATACTLTVAASGVADADADDPPDQMAADFASSFTTANPPAPAASGIVINELDADTPGTDVAEFVELFDGGAGNTPLDGLVVVFINGNGGGSYAAFDLDGFATDAGGYFTLGNAGVSGVDLVFNSNVLQNGEDAVALYAANASDFPAGTPLTTANLRDAVVYDTDDANEPALLALLNAGQFQVNENGGGSGTAHSSQRCPNGSGGERNTSTYLQAAPSPDGANTCPPPPAPSNSVIVISQVYGAGGNAGAIFQNDYVELYNRGTAPVDVRGWSLQYASASGNAWDFNRQPLGGVIAPGQYYLISLASGGDDGAALPAANIAGGLINMSGASGKIALVDSFDALAGNCPTADPHVMDFVGYGSADCREGTTTAPSPGTAGALFRLGGGATDTDRNGSDFVTAAPSPRRTAPIVELGPMVLATDPGSNRINAPRDATIQVTFTEPVDVSGAWFDITCAASGQHNSVTSAGGGRDRYLTPNVELLPGELCTVTIFKDQVSDQDLDDAGPDTNTLPADHVWTFAVATGAAPPYPPSVHLALGNPSGAAASPGTPDDYLMEKPEYALSYNRGFGRPNWVSWHLSDEWVGSLARVDSFRPDPAIPPDWYRVQSFDFSGTGFDRGHMVPNADRDKETSIPINQATFLMSNMLAQAPDNNQGPWAELENYLRTLLPAGEMYIVAGGVGAGGTGGNGGVTTTLAGGRVTVPSHTWKVALVIPKDGGDDLSRVTCTTRTIAVLMPNTQGIRTEPWETFLTTVDAVEGVTGYDLFSNLPEPIQRCVEAGTNGNNPPLVKGDQTISFDAPADRPYDDPPFVVTATGGASGNPVTFTASGACTSGGANGATITIVAAGACTITASQAGSELYDAAPDVSRTLLILDTIAPVISPVTTTPDRLGPPNHKMVDVTVAYTATDFSGAPVCTLTVSSSEPADGPGDGSTSADWTVVDAHRVQLRAERSGTGSGRTYTIGVRCTDASGNAATASATVSVPKQAL
jgi:DNA/RNA endonuclease G (NUC1)